MCLQFALSLHSSSANHYLRVFDVPLGDHDPPEDDLDPVDLVAVDGDLNPAELGAGDTVLGLCCSLVAGVTLYAYPFLEELRLYRWPPGDEDRPLCDPCCLYECLYDGRDVELALPYLGLYGSLDQLLVGARPDLDPWLLIDLPLEFLVKYVFPPDDLEPDTSLGTFLPMILLGWRL